MKIKKVIKKLKFILSIIFILIIGLLALWFIKSPTFEMDVNVVNGKLGVHSDSDSLIFGDINSGSSALRTMGLRALDKKIRVYFLPLGNISKYITINPKHFMLDAEERKVVEIECSIPTSVEDGNFSGTMKMLRLPF